MNQLVSDLVEVTNELTAELKALGTEERAVNEKRYLKSEIEHLGVKVPEIRKLARRFARERRDLGKLEIKDLTHELWGRYIYELRKLAVNILAARVGVFGLDDVAFVEGLLRRSHTWALIDDLSINVVAPMLEDVDGADVVRKKWSNDVDFWVRRTAMLGLLPRLRRGRDGWEEFAGYADGMLGEDEFFIQKAIGWVLREVSKHSPELVFGWIEPRAGMASSVTMREAVKYLPKDHREILVEIRRSGQRRSSR